MSLQKYKTPDSIRVGTWIELDDAPGVRALVKIPSAHNKAYQFELMRSARNAVQVTRDGDKVTTDIDFNRVDIGEMMESQHAAFVNKCIVKFEGEGVEELNDADLLNDYTALVEELFEKAKILADEFDEAAEEVAKK